MIKTSNSNNLILIIDDLFTKIARYKLIKVNFNILGYVNMIINVIVKLH